MKATLAGVITFADTILREHINVHVRGGSILPLQEPAYTTSLTRANPYSLVVALDESGEASGSLYLDDGESLVQNATKLVQVSRHCCHADQPN